MSDYLNNVNAGMDWNDSIENDGQEFVILPEGDYNFTITNLERGHFPGSAKMSACNKASLTLQVETEDGIATVFTDLILNRLVEWRVSAFFRCIGRKKHGERLIMDWNNIIGSKGRAHFRPRTYIAKDGTERQVNDVTRFYDYDEKYFPTDDGWTEISESDENLPWE